MRARRTASHREKEWAKLLPRTSQTELAAEYRNLLLRDPESRARLNTYVKIVPPLLQCQSAHLLFVLDNDAEEIAHHHLTMSRGTLDQAFYNYLGKHAIAFENDLSEASDLDWRKLADTANVRSYASAPIAINGLPLCILVATDDKPHSWSEDDFQHLKNVVEMLKYSLEVSRERQLITVQRRMQRSLVQFVRGNLSVVEREAAGQWAMTRTESLESDLDEDLETDDLDDETEQVETSRMNIMFDFSARLIRRTLKVAGCVLINIENLTELENIEADFPARSTIMGACFLKHLRTTDWHENQSDGRGSDHAYSTHSLGSGSDTFQSKKVPRNEVFDPRGLSGPWLKRSLEDHPRAVSFDGDNLPEALTILLPAGVRSCLLSPIYDSNAKAFALIIAFDDKSGNFTKADAHYIEAFGSSIYAEVLNQTLQRANDAKSLFISKISHEFRTPLHGVLASAEFLNDMAETTPTQLDFIQTIDSCGRTLLDIINHVLDYSKLSFSSNILQTDLTSDFATFEDFDVVEVAEQVLGAAFSSYEFKKINEYIDVQKSNSQASQSDADSGSICAALGRNLEVVMLVNSNLQGYLVHSDLGAFKRIILNLLGNALKYTLSGHVLLELSVTRSSQDTAGELNIIVVDTGIGISNAFLSEMFNPFTQEHEFSAGTGLGLSIVKELSKRLHGKIDVKSRKGRGSRFSVSYPVITTQKQLVASLFPGNTIRHELQGTKFHYFVATENTADNIQISKSTVLLRTSIVRYLETWYGMQNTSMADAQILLTDDMAFENGIQTIARFQGPIMTLCSTTAKYEQSRAFRPSSLRSFISKPCGPVKLGVCVVECLTRASNFMRLTDTCQAPIEQELEQKKHVGSLPYKEGTQLMNGPLSPSSSSPSRPGMSRGLSNITGGSRRTIREEHDAQSLADLYAMNNLTQCNSPIEQNSIRSTDLPFVDIRPRHNEKILKSLTIARNTEPMDTGLFDQAASSSSKRHVLIVEDNPVNMMLLATFSKRQGITVTTAVNGSLAVQRVRDRAKPFDLILMDINMPVMDGFQAIENIRAHEVTEGLEGLRAKIVALTGLSTPQDRAKAFKFGADAFFTKPVKMADLRTLFVQWGILDDGTASSKSMASLSTVSSA